MGNQWVKWSGILLLILMLGMSSPAFSQSPWVHVHLPDSVRNSYPFAYKAKNYLPWQAGRKLALFRSGKVDAQQSVHPYLDGLAEKTLKNWPDSVPFPKVYLIDDPRPGAGHSPNGPEQPGLILLNRGLIATLQNEIQLEFIIANCATHLLLETPEVLPAPVCGWKTDAEKVTFGYDYQNSKQKACSETRFHAADSIAFQELLASHDLPKVMDALAAFMTDSLPVFSLSPASMLNALNITPPDSLLKPFKVPQTRFWVPAGYHLLAGKGISEARKDLNGRMEKLGIGHQEGATHWKNSADWQLLKLECLRDVTDLMLSEGRVEEALLETWKILSSGGDDEWANLQMTRLIILWGMAKSQDTGLKAVTQTDLDDWLSKIPSAHWTAVALKFAWQQWQSHSESYFLPEAIAFLMEKLEAAGFDYASFFPKGGYPAGPGLLNGIFRDFEADPLFREMLFRFLENPEPVYSPNYYSPPQQGSFWSLEENPAQKWTGEWEEGKIVIGPMWWDQMQADRSRTGFFLPGPELVLERAGILQEGLNRISLKPDIFEPVSAQPEKYEALNREMTRFQAWRSSRWQDLPYPLADELQYRAEQANIRYWVTIGAFLVAEKQDFAFFGVAGNSFLGLFIPGFLAYSYGNRIAFQNNTRFFLFVEDLKEMETLGEILFDVEQKDRWELIRGRLFDMLRLMEKGGVK